MDSEEYCNQYSGEFMQGENRRGGPMDKTVTFSFSRFLNKLTILSSIFIALSFLYSAVIKKSLYQLTIHGSRYVMFVSITSIVLHLISIYKNGKNRKFAFLLSVSVPLLVVGYLTIGFIGWYSGLFHLKG